MQGPMVLERADGGPGGGPPGTVVLFARANVFFGGDSFLPPPYFINY